jgi:hypothetical protein
VVKVSGSRWIKFIDCTINPDGGNREDGIDIMRNSFVSLQNCQIGAGKKYAVTVKGGSAAVIGDCVILRHGGFEGVDIDIGNFSHTVPNLKTGVVVLSGVTALDGKPVTVRVGWSEKPIVVGGNVKILFWQSLALKVYVFVKRMILKWSGTK